MGDPIQHAVDEGGGFLGPEFLAQLDRLVQGDTHRDVGAAEDLVHRQPEDVAVHPRHALQLPVGAALLDDRVDLAALRLDAAHQLIGEAPGDLVGVLEVREHAPDGVARVPAAQVELVKRLQGTFARFGPRSHSILPSDPQRMDLLDARQRDLAALVRAAWIRALLRLLQRLAGEHAEGDRQGAGVGSTLHRQRSERARHLVAEHAVVVGPAADQASERDDPVDAALAGDARRQRTQLERAWASVDLDAVRLALGEGQLRSLEELVDDLRIPAGGHDREPHSLRGEFPIGRRSQAHARTSYFFVSESRCPILSRFDMRYPSFSRDSPASMGTRSTTSRSYSFFRPSIFFGLLVISRSFRTPTSLRICAPMP